MSSLFPSLPPLSRAGRAVILALACVLAPARAHAQYPDTTMFAVNATTALYTVQRATGATAQIGTLSFNTSAIARDPATGRIYYTSTNYFPTSGNGRVAYWDPVTKTNTVLNATGNGDNIVRLAFNSAGHLYGIGSISPTTLYDISPTTGAITSVGPVKLATTGADLGASGDLSFDWDGTLYAHATDALGHTILYQIAMTPSSGAYLATAIGQVTTAIEASLAFGADGQLYSGGSNGTMYVVNKTTGAVISTVTTTGIPYYDFATSPLFADLSVTGSSPGLPRGGTANYTIVVSNAGPSAATGQVTVVDSLPAGLTYASVSGTGWTCSAATRRVTCTNPGPIAAGSSSTLVLSATVAATATGSLTDVVRVLGSTIDQDQTNNRASFATATVVNIELAVNKSHSGSFTAGLNGAYTLTIQNTGTVATSAAAIVTDTLPTGMGFVSGSGTAWSCTSTASTPVIATCTRANTTPLGAGATSAPLTLTVSVSAAAAPSRTNVAWVSGGGAYAPASSADPTTVNTTGVSVTPNLSAVTSLPSNGTVYTENFTVTNTGTVADVFQLAVTRAPGTVVTVVKTNGVTGTTGSVSVAAGASIVVPVTDTIPPGAVTGARDTLRLMATSTTVTATKDSGSYVITVARAGLGMTKRLYKADLTTPIISGAQVAPGDTVNFLVTVTGTGSAVATAVHVVDPLPAGVRYLAATGDLTGWTFSQASGIVTADLAGTLTSGASRFFWIKVVVQ